MNTKSRLEQAISLLVLSVFFGPAALAGGGGGSSGIGNHLSIGQGLETEVPASSQIVKRGDILADGITGEPLVRIETVASSDLKKYGENLVQSHLGRVDGFEFLPNKNSLGKFGNIWIICGKNSRCLRLSPLSKTNPKVLEIIGGLETSARR